MTILSGQTIRSLGIFTPFNERTVFNGMSYGLSYAGYDVRIAEDVTLSASPYGPFKFSLASTLERFEMPDDCLAFVKDKSSWARQGLSVFNTVIEPSWNGHLTLELVYHGNEVLRILAGSPIAQIVFHKLDTAPEFKYEGKYQNQESGAQSARFEVSK